MQDCTDVQINILLLKLDSGKATGTDETTKKMRTCQHVLAQSLFVTFLISFYQSAFPDCLKTAALTTVYEMGLKQKFEKNRTIPVLPYSKKLLQRTMYFRIQSFLITSTTQYIRQFGFQLSVPTTDVLVDETEKIRFAKSNVCCCIFFHIEKPFDTKN